MPAGDEGNDGGADGAIWLSSGPQHASPQVEACPQGSSHCHRLQLVHFVAPLSGRGTVRDSSPVAQEIRRDCAAVRGSSSVAEEGGTRAGDLATEGNAAGEAQGGLGMALGGREDGGAGQLRQPAYDLEAGIAGDKVFVHLL